MKTVYIPKGEMVSYESITTDHLVVHGYLNVACGIKAKTISGNGIITAGTVSADSIRVNDLETTAVFCKRLVAKRVQAPEVFASESAAVSCFLSSAYVETGKLTVAISETDEVKADEVVNLKPRKRGLLRTLLASALLSFWTKLFATPVCANALDAEYEPAEAEEPTPVESAVDEELNRIIGLYQLSKASGYTLRLIPGTPAENAPVLDLNTHETLRPAA